MRSGRIRPLACFALAKTWLNNAIDRMLKPGMPALETPIISAPSAANTQSEGSLISCLRRTGADGAGRSPHRIAGPTAERGLLRKRKESPDSGHRDADRASRA